MGRALILLLLCATGCCGPVAGLYPPPDVGSSLDIYVYNNHWHSGFVIERATLSPTLQKYLARFNEAKFIEIGWGDEAFYRAPAATSGLALQAMFASRGSVLHIAAFDEDPAEHYRQFAVELFRVRVSAAGFARLNQFLEARFATTDAGDSQPLQPGLYGVSYFFAARGKYCLFHTCNNWTADGLRTTGFPISPFYAQTANNVAWQIRHFGNRFQSDLLIVNQ